MQLKQVESKSLLFVCLFYPVLLNMWLVCWETWVSPPGKENILKIHKVPQNTPRYNPLCWFSRYDTSCKCQGYRYRNDTNHINENVPFPFYIFTILQPFNHWNLEGGGETISYKGKVKEGWPNKLLWCVISRPVNARSCSSNNVIVSFLNKYLN